MKRGGRVPVEGEGIHSQDLQASGAFEVWELLDVSGTIQGSANRENRLWRVGQARRHLGSRPQLSAQALPLGKCHLPQVSFKLATLAPLEVEPCLAGSNSLFVCFFKAKSLQAVLEHTA